MDNATSHNQEEESEDPAEAATRLGQIIKKKKKKGRECRSTEIDNANNYTEITGITRGLAVGATRVIDSL
jgi:hypothetical protein